MGRSSEKYVTVVNFLSHASNASVRLSTTIDIISLFVDAISTSFLLFKNLTIDLTGAILGQNFNLSLCIFTPS